MIYDVIEQENKDTKPGQVRLILALMSVFT